MILHEDGVKRSNAGEKKKRKKKDHLRQMLCYGLICCNIKRYKNITEMKVVFSIGSIFCIML